MKFYSEVLNKVFNTEEDLARAEKHFADNQKDKADKADKIKELKAKGEIVTKEANELLTALTEKIAEMHKIDDEIDKLENKKADSIFEEIINAIFK